MNTTLSSRRAWFSPWPMVAAAFGVLFLGTLAAYACNVPVFRYALEHWRADPYRITLFHEGPLSEAQQTLIRPLEMQQERALANLTFRTVELSELDDADRELLASQQDPQLPWLVVQYPASLRIHDPMWAGPLTEEAVTGWTTSPVRQELIRRLAEGQTAVWLLLESGDAEKDNAAVALLETELKVLEKGLPLPELSGAPEDQLLADVPLRVEFSVLRVPRSEEEKALVAMLLHSEPDLPERSDPMVFPVFGRGRALLPLVGAGITAENIHDSAIFLIGPCSCQVKELNPGFDLLLSDEWDRLISQEVAPQPISTASVSIPDEPELVPIPSGAPSDNSRGVSEPNPVVTPSTSTFASLWLIGGAAVVGLLLVVGLAALALGNEDRSAKG